MLFPYSSSKIICHASAIYNTTPEEVRREMQIAIDAGFDNPDPAVQEEWKKMTLKGDRPTPEEVINYAVKKLKGK